MSGKTAGRTTLHSGLAFAYRLGRSGNAAGEALFLLHGSGVDETTLVTLGGEIAPDATLLAVRGRIPQDGGWRWFERITPTRFGQASIRAEADALAAFIPEAAAAHGIDLDRTIFLGYSNGANLISSVMLRHPGLIGRAALLRPMPVLDDVPPAGLSTARILVIAGDADATYAPFAPDLVALLGERGADVEFHTIASGHEVGEDDARIVKRWLERLKGRSTR